MTHTSRSKIPALKIQGSTDIKSIRESLFDALTILHHSVQSDGSATQTGVLRPTRVFKQSQNFSESDRVYITAILKEMNLLTKLGKAKGLAYGWKLGTLNELDSQTDKAIEKALKEYAKLTTKRRKFSVKKKKAALQKANAQEDQEPIVSTKVTPGFNVEYHANILKEVEKIAAERDEALFEIAKLRSEIESLKAQQNDPEVLQSAFLKELRSYSSK